MSRGFASNYRIVLLAIGLFGCFGGLGARLVCLHVLDRDELLRTIVKTRRQDFRDTAERGEILDTKNAKLATNRPMILVAVDPSMFRPEDEAKLPELAQLLRMPLADVRRICMTKYRSIAAKAASATNGAGAAAAAVATKPATMLKLDLPAVPPAADRRGGDDPDPDFGGAVAANNDDTSGAKTGLDVTKTDNDDETETDPTPEPDGRRLIRWAKLSDHVSESTYSDIEGLGLRPLCPPERRYARVYPHGQLAAHVIGFVNHQGVGVQGIERYADFYLRGQDGWREGEKDGRRRELAQFQTRNIPRSDGYSVVLSIDTTVQDIIERQLDQIAKTYQPLKATIIVSDPRTGFILGLANYPTFDPNEYNLVPRDQQRRLKNVAVTDVYEPGSVFKIVPAAAAIEEGLVNEGTTFNCSLERINYKGKDLKMPRDDHRADHPLTVAEIISHSSNRGAGQLAMLLGDERFERYARAFGFGATFGFPGVIESPGILHPHEEWVPIDITRIAMGQSIAATALQMHQAMATVANDGVLMRPQVIRQIRDTSNVVVLEYGPTEIRRVMSARTARRVARLLVGVASPGGTAPEAAIKINGTDFEVAGKTGTAQKYMKETLANGKTKLLPSNKHHVASFIGFFPASCPQVAISVIVDDADAHAPGGVAYGAKVAAPVFKSIGEQLIPILSITPPNQPARLNFVAATQGGRR
jgi:cell division protein FtsI/penicillin-binding protein 2